jgi:hypothetical protein
MNMISLNFNFFGVIIFINFLISYNYIDTNKNSECKILGKFVFYYLIL